MKLTLRMEKIKSLINYLRVADIGCDHGKIIAKAFLDNQIEFAIESDISPLSANRAEQQLINLNIPKEKYSVRIGDGLSVIKPSDNIEQVIITGMGGLKIINILSASTLKFKSLILGAQRDYEKMLEYVLATGYKIDKEIQVLDNGKNYKIIRVNLGE